MFENIVCTDGNYICQSGCAFTYCNCENIVLIIGVVVAIVTGILFWWCYHDNKRSGELG